MKSIGKHRSSAYLFLSKPVRCGSLRFFVSSVVRYPFGSCVCSCIAGSLLSKWIQMKFKLEVSANEKKGCPTWNKSNAEEQRCSVMPKIHKDDFRRTGWSNGFPAMGYPIRLSDYPKRISNEIIQKKRITRRSYHVHKFDILTRSSNQRQASWSVFYHLAAYFWLPEPLAVWSVENH